MSCWIFLIFLIPVFFGTILAVDCGNVPESRDVPEGETVNIKFLPKPTRRADVWYFSLDGTGPNIVICWNCNSSCTSQKYHLHRDTLTVNNFTRRDAGHYRVKCYSGTWSFPTVLSIKLADKSSSKEEQDISTENTNKYRHTTLVTAREEKETVKTEATDSTKDYKVSSTLEDTSQVITMVFAGGVAVGVVVTVIVVVIIYKNRKKDDIRRGGQKSGPTQTNLKGAEDQGNGLQNDSNRLHKRDQSEQEASAVQHNQEINSDGQQASGSANEQTDSKYEVIIPVTDRAVSIQEREVYKMIKAEEEGIPEYEMVS